MSNNVNGIPNPTFKDRTIGLIAFGVIQILMGIFCAMIIPLMLVVTTMQPQTAPSANLRTMTPVLGGYGMMAIILIWLGIGSILARRWARALTLTASWVGLVIGIFSTVLMCFWLPSIQNMSPQNAQMPPEFRIVFVISMLATTGCIYVAIPGAFIAFYRSHHVKATCEAKNPRPSWTDACPLPVLAMSLILGFSAASILPSLAYGTAIPFFGILLTGSTSVVAGGIIAAVFACLAWGMYKQKMSAWWTTLAIFCVMTVSGLITFSRIGMLEFYRAANIPEDQIDIMVRSGMLERMNFPLMMGSGLAVYIGYLIWIRKYFVAAATTNAAPQPDSPDQG